MKSEQKYFAFTLLYNGKIRSSCTETLVIYEHFLETTKHVCKLDKARHIEVSVIIRLDEAIFFQRGREFLPLSINNNSYVD